MIKRKLTIRLYLQFLLRLYQMWQVVRFIATFVESAVWLLQHCTHCRVQLQVIKWETQATWGLPLSCLQSNELDDGNAHYLSLSVETSIITASSWGEIPLLYKYCSQDKRKTGFRVSNTKHTDFRLKYIL